MKTNNLIKTFYYFRAGDTLKLISPKEEIVDLEKVEKATIPPNGFGLIRSREHFTFDSSIMAIFGNVSDLIKRGLQMVNSPSIDPGFEGHLTLGIKNLTDRPVDISCDEKIGKILFFNVADTVLEYGYLVEEPEIREKLSQRQKGEEFL
nr:hypothetical protein [Bacteroidota bacterium]